MKITRLCYLRRAVCSVALGTIIIGCMALTSATPAGAQSFNERQGRSVAIQLLNGFLEAEYQRSMRKKAARKKLMQDWSAAAGGSTGALRRTRPADNCHYTPRGQWKCH